MYRKGGKGDTINGYKDRKSGEGGSYEKNQGG